MLKFTVVQSLRWQVVAVHPSSAVATAREPQPIAPVYVEKTAGCDPSAAEAQMPRGADLVQEPSTEILCAWQLAQQTSKCDGHLMGTTPSDSVAEREEICK